MFSDHDENDESSVGSGSGYDSEGVLNISGDLGSPTQFDHTGMNSDGEGSQTQPQVHSHFSTLCFFCAFKKSRSNGVFENPLPVSFYLPVRLLFSTAYFSAAAVVS